MIKKNEGTFFAKLIQNFPQIRFLAQVSFSIIPIL